MIWNSIPLMTAIDILIILVVIYLVANLFKHYEATKQLGLTVGMYFIMFGLVVMAVFYATDLAVMNIFTLSGSRSESMAVMTNLHLNWSWLEALVVIGMIAIGLSYLLRSLIPSAMRDLQALTLNLQQAEEKYRELFENAGDGIFRLTPDGLRLSLANPAMVGILGYESADDLLDGVNDIGHQIYVDPDRHKRRMELLLEPGAVNGFESQVHRKNGGVRVLTESTRAIRDAEKKLQGFEGIVKDITERKRREEALRESEERFRQLAEVIDDVFVIADLKNSSLLYASPNYEKLAGRPVQDLYEKFGIWDESAHPEDLLNTREAWARMIEQGSPYDEEYRMIRPDGSLIWVRDRGYPVRDESGQIYRAAGIVQDITARKQQEEELHKTQALYRQAEQMGQLGHWEWDNLNDKLISCSEQFAQIYEMSVDEALDYFSNMEPEFGVIHPDDRERYRQHRDNAAQQRDGLDIEFRIITRSDAVRYIYLQGDFVLDDQDRLIKSFGTVQDISERRQAEEKIAFQASLLEQVHNAVITIDFENKILSWNNHAEVLYQWKSEEAIGKDIIELLSPEELKSTVEENFSDLNRDGHSEGEFNVLRKDGTTIPAHIINTYLKDPNENNIGFIGISNDITASKQAQDALARHNRAMEALYQTSLEINAQSDLTTLFQSIVQRAMSLLQTPQGALSLLQPDGRTVKRVALQSYDSPSGFTEIALGEGLAGRVVQSGEPQMIGDYGSWIGRLPDSSFKGRTLGVPLKREEHVIGVLLVGNADELGKFDEAEVQLLSMFANQAAGAIENVRLFEAEQKQHALAEVLRETAEKLSQSLNLNVVLDCILANMHRIIPHEVSAIALIKADGSLEVARHRGFEERGLADWMSQRRFMVAEFPTDRELAQRETSLIISDTRNSDLWVVVPQMDWVRSFMAMPIRVRDEHVGNISLISSVPFHFLPEHSLPLQAFANQAAVAIENVRLFEGLRESEARYRAIVEDQTEFIVRSLPDGTRSFVNEAYSRYLGQPAEALTGLNIHDQATNMERQDFENILALLKPVNPAVTKEYQVLLSNGNEAWIQWTDRAIFDGDDELVEIQSVGLDISVQKQAQRAEHAAITAERKRLAHELHDAVTQSLYSLLFLAKAAGNFAASGKWDQARDNLVAVQESAQKVLKEMRLLVYELLPASLQERGLVDVLEHRLGAVEQRSGMETHFNAEGNIELPTVLQFGIYRIAQEALNNVLKHASASDVNVHLSRDGERIEMKIEDNGIGFDLNDSSAGIGLQSMRERAEAMGGVLRITSKMGAGTSVRLVIEELAA